MKRPPRTVQLTDAMDPSGFAVGNLPASQEVDVLAAHPRDPHERRGSSSTFHRRASTSLTPHSSHSRHPTAHVPAAAEVPPDPVVTLTPGSMEELTDFVERLVAASKRKTLSLLRAPQGLDDVARDADAIESVMWAATAADDHLRHTKAVADSGARDAVPLSEVEPNPGETDEEAAERARCERELALAKHRLANAFRFAHEEVALHHATIEAPGLGERDYVAGLRRMDQERTALMVENDALRRRADKAESRLAVAERTIEMRKAGHAESVREYLRELNIVREKLQDLQAKFDATGGQPPPRLLDYHRLLNLTEEERRELKERDDAQKSASYLLQRAEEELALLRHAVKEATAYTEDVKGEYDDAVAEVAQLRREMLSLLEEQERADTAVQADIAAKQRAIDRATALMDGLTAELDAAHTAQGASETRIATAELNAAKMKALAEAALADAAAARNAAEKAGVEMSAFSQREAEARAAAMAAAAEAASSAQAAEAAAAAAAEVVAAKRQADELALAAAAASAAAEARARADAEAAALAAAAQAALDAQSAGPDAESSDARTATPPEPTSPDKDSDQGPSDTGERAGSRRASERRGSTLSALGARNIGVDGADAGSSQTRGPGGSPGGLSFNAAARLRRDLESTQARLALAAEERATLEADLAAAKEDAAKAWTQASTHRAQYDSELEAVKKQSAAMERKMQREIQRLKDKEAALEAEMRHRADSARALAALREQHHALLHDATKMVHQADIVEEMLRRYMGSDAKSVKEFRQRLEALDLDDELHTPRTKAFMCAKHGCRIVMKQRPGTTAGMPKMSPRRKKVDAAPLLFRTEYRPSTNPEDLVAEVVQVPPTPGSAAGSVASLDDLLRPSTPARTPMASARPASRDPEPTDSVAIPGVVLPACPSPTEAVSLDASGASGLITTAGSGLAVSQLANVVPRGVGRTPSPLPASGGTPYVATVSPSHPASVGPGTPGASTGPGPAGSPSHSPRKARQQSPLTTAAAAAARAFSPTRAQGPALSGGRARTAPESRGRSPAPVEHVSRFAREDVSAERLQYYRTHGDVHDSPRRAVVPEALAADAKPSEPGPVPEDSTAAAHATQPARELSPTATLRRAAGHRPAVVQPLSAEDLVGVPPLLGLGVTDAGTQHQARHAALRSQYAVLQRLFQELEQERDELRDQLRLAAVRSKPPPGDAPDTGSRPLSPLQGVRSLKRLRQADHGAGQPSDGAESPAAAPSCDVSVIPQESAEEVATVEGLVRSFPGIEHTGDLFSAAEATHQLNCHVRRLVRLCAQSAVHRSMYPDEVVAERALLQERFVALRAVEGSGAAVVRHLAKSKDNILRHREEDLERVLQSVSNLSVTHPKESERLMRIAKTSAMQRQVPITGVVERPPSAALNQTPPTAVALSFSKASKAPGATPNPRPGTAGGPKRKGASTRRPASATPTLPGLHGSTAVFSVR